MPKRTEVDRRARAPRRNVKSPTPVPESAHPPTWIKTQLTRLADEAPAGSDWLHEIKYDGYRMHARLDHGKVQLLTRTGLDWSNLYPYPVSALRALRAKTAYIDDELCALRADGAPSFGLLQAAMDQGRTNSLVFFAFDLLYLDGVLKPLETPRMPLDKPPPHENRFGSPLELSRVHWVRPEVVVEVTYLTWTEGGLLRAVSYQGQREDKPASQVVRPIPHPL